MAAVGKREVDQVQQQRMEEAEKRRVQEEEERAAKVRKVGETQA